MSFTYLQLAQQILKMNDKQRKSEVMIHLTETDDYFLARDLKKSTKQDELDKGQPFITIDT